MPTCGRESNRPRRWRLVTPQRVPSAALSAASSCICRGRRTRVRIPLGEPPIAFASASTPTRPASSAAGATRAATVAPRLGPRKHRADRAVAGSAERRVSRNNRARQRTSVRAGRSRRSPARAYRPPASPSRQRRRGGHAHWSGLAGARPHRACGRGSASRRPCVSGPRSCASRGSRIGTVSRWFDSPLLARGSSPMDGLTPVTDGRG